MIEIRRAEAGDAAELAALAAETFPFACPPSTTAEAIADFIAANFAPEHFAAYLSDPGRAILVAEDEERLLGYTMLVFDEPADADVAGAISLRPTAELSKVYARRSVHGGAVAAPLMAATLAAAAERGVAGVWLGVNIENGRAIRFYEKSGFARVGLKRFRLGGRFEDDYVLERPL